MRTAGALLLVVSGLIWGLGRAGELRRRVELLEEIYGAARRLKAEIYYSSRPIGELIRMCGGRLCSMAAQSRSFQSDPAGALAAAAEELFKKREDRELAQGLAKGLGASDTQGQMEHLELYSALLESRLQKAREELSRKSRLYPCLGLFTGLGLSILLI